MTEPLDASTLRGSMLLIRLMSLACCISLLSCDQFATIAVVDSGLNPNISLEEPPNEPADASADLDSFSNPPIVSNDDASVIVKPADAGIQLDASSNPPIDANADVNVTAGCVDRPTVAGECDPTQNDNRCPVEMMMKCFIDFEEATPSGYCSFLAPMPTQSFCLWSGLTDSCLPTYYCYKNTACRKICLCDEDCLPGECCTDPVGGGFKLCAAC